MAVKKEDAEALANECAQLTTGLPMGDPLLRKEREPDCDCAPFGRCRDRPARKDITQATVLQAAISV